MVLLNIPKHTTHSITDWQVFLFLSLLKEHHERGKVGKYCVLLLLSNKSSHFFLISPSKVYSIFPPFSSTPGGVTVAEPDLGGVPRPSDDIQTPYSTSMSELRRKLILLEVQSSARSSLPVSLPIHPTPEKLKLWFPTVNAGVTPPPAAPRYPAVTWWRPTHSRNMSEYKHSFGRSFLARTDKI